MKVRANMKKRIELNARAEELLNFLWTYNEALTSTEMLEKLEMSGWNKVTLLKTIQLLTDSGYLEVVGFEKSGKTYARKLMPSLTKAEYYSDLLLKKGIGSNSIAEITAALLGASKKKKPEKNAEIIAKLEEVIAELKADGTENR